MVVVVVVVHDDAAAVAALDDDVNNLRITGVDRDAIIMNIFYRVRARTPSIG